MALTVPDNPKIYTTTYDNFRGVDFTNDATNVWRRRSPTGKNMLPDASGRPFKRHGWEILISNADISQALQVETCTIQKCAWFELGGVDHIVIFTNCGVAFYKGHQSETDHDFTATCDDFDCYSGYDRCFFFEGNGLSAFYIYGNLKVWRYMYDPTDANAVDGFTFYDVSDEATVPTVIIGASADGTGTNYDGYNLLGTKAAVEYNDINLYTWWCSDGLSIEVSDTLKADLTLNKPIYRWTWNGTTWATTAGGLSFPSSKINVHGTPQYDSVADVGDEIIIVYAYGVLLPNNVTDANDVSVFASSSLQYDTALTVIDSGTLATGECRLWTDDTMNYSNKRAWIQFCDNWTEILAGADFIKVVFPSVLVSMTQYGASDAENCHFTGTANLVGV